MSWHVMVNPSFAGWLGGMLSNLKGGMLTTYLSVA